MLSVAQRGQPLDFAALRRASDPLKAAGAANIPWTVRSRVGDLVSSISVVGGIGAGKIVLTAAVTAGACLAATSRAGYA